ncbi:MAG TPA: MFS transporter, partial [Polyangia bacterium]|nr:MFS transporter [Polyangia bacterium]
MDKSASKHWIADWNPEDEGFWRRKGRRIARRNLFWSIVAENIGFSVWLIWSVTATRLNKIGFHYTTDQLFQLVAIPGLVGSLMRFPYTFAVPRFGGRNWTIVS